MLKLRIKDIPGRLASDIVRSLERVAPLTQKEETQTFYFLLVHLIMKDEHESELLGGAGNCPDSYVWFDVDDAQQPVHSTDTSS
jgi:hypothetical protein